MYFLCLRFLLEALSALRQDLRHKGSDLMFCIGKTEAAMADIVRQLGENQVRGRLRPECKPRHMESSMTAVF